MKTFIFERIGTTPYGVHKNNSTLIIIRAKNEKDVIKHTLFDTFYLFGSMFHCSNNGTLFLDCKCKIKQEDMKKLQNEAYKEYKDDFRKFVEETLPKAREKHPLFRDLSFTFTTNYLEHVEDTVLQKYANCTFEAEFDMLEGSKMKTYKKDNSKYILDYTVNYSFEELILAISSKQIKLKLFERNLLLIIKRFLY